MRTSHIFTAALLAASAAWAEPVQYLDLRTPRVALNARVTGQDVSSPDLQLGFSDEALRGRAFGLPLNLSFDAARIRGIYGSGPVDLRLTQEQGALRAKGTFGGQLTDFQVTPQTLKGDVGRCSYELKASEDGRYQGWRSCLAGLENPVSLSIPPALGNDDARLVATLALILSR
ncbi:hypothetical protein [Corallococcus macrosporus]|uniref:Uncharacterized protein n=1 Tax=Corallococcus macrosporus DSM 14697 TaxID=1189310 RepID=A0A250JMZ1_9BACT|nr:hypothetical protein [Corallococcus macrosporus]ATB44867.1 hypothetical protein MYMAC_000449 [Corallococcus macrosporus DSM 14697]